LKFRLKISVVTALLLMTAMISGCNFMTHRTLSSGTKYDSTVTDPEPNYDISLDFEYQDFASYMFMGNRIENFTAYFNTFFKSTEEFDEAFEEYRAAIIAVFDSRLDSLGITPPVSASVKDKLNKVIERSSKIIQFHKNSKFIDDAVLQIGKSYYILGDYLNAERKFNEFLSKLSSSEKTDEAILYLSRSKFRSGNKTGGEAIVRNLLKEATNNEIKSLAARDLGVIEYNRRNIDEAVKHFKSSIKFSEEDERKAEGQFILAKILSVYKPNLSAEEFRKVLDYTSDFDLSFYAKLNSAKGLIYNREYRKAEEILLDLRKDYREITQYTQLVDLEIANALYGMGNLKKASEKYFEVIVKYPGSVASSGAYYFLGKHEEEVNKNFLKALMNYQKAAAENSQSDYFSVSSDKSKTLEKYFELRGEIAGSDKIKIPTRNEELEKFRVQYNKERGIETPQGTEGTEGQEGPKDGTQTGDGKGKSGGLDINESGFKDSSDNKTKSGINPGNLPGKDSEPILDLDKGVEKDAEIDKETGMVMPETKDTSNQISDSLKLIEERSRKFNAYFELSELFMYNLDNSDSAEFYLKYLLENFQESEYQSKVLYMLANFYKNSNRLTDADETFKKIISTYPNTIYGYESKKILGIKTDESDIAKKPIDEIFSNALEMYNKGLYSEAIIKLYEVVDKFPEDTSLAKAYYGIGFIYENNLFDKDSSIRYYKLVNEKFPSSEYSLKVIPKLEYIASLEVKDTTSTDTTEVQTSDTLLKKESEINPEEKITSEEEVKPEITNPDDSEKLTQEEIDKLLKETEKEESGQ